MMFVERWKDFHFLCAIRCSVGSGRLLRCRHAGQGDGRKFEITSSSCVILSLKLVLCWSPRRLVGDLVERRWMLISCPLPWTLGTIATCAASTFPLARWRCGRHARPDETQNSRERDEGRKLADYKEVSVDIDSLSRVVSKINSPRFNIDRRLSPREE